LIDWRGGVSRKDRALEQAADLPAFLGAHSEQTWIVAMAWLCKAYREVGCWH
jgi:hypothetical protein